MKRKPYIGVTGFTSAGQVTQVLDGMDFKKAERLLMVGVLASSKTLTGGQHKWPNRYPALEDLAAIFPEHKDCLNLIHYHTKEKETLLDQLLEVTEISGPNMHGFQLNVAWPDPAVLHAFKAGYEDKTIVLQIGAGAFKKAFNNPTHVANKLVDYLGLIDYVLLDPSGGLGLPMNPHVLRGYLEALQEYQGFGIGIAGGLSPTMLSIAEPLLTDYPDISIDAEGKLRTIDDQLDIAVAKAYIERSLNMVAQHA